MALTCSEASPRDQKKPPAHAGGMECCGLPNAESAQEVGESRQRKASHRHDQRVGSLPGMALRIHQLLEVVVAHRALLVRARL